MPPSLLYLIQNVVSEGCKAANKRGKLALYRSTSLYVKSLHAKHYNTWPIGFKHEAPDIELVALVFMISNKKISKDFYILAHVKLMTPGDGSNSTLGL